MFEVFGPHMICNRPATETPCEVGLPKKHSTDSFLPLFVPGTPSGETKGKKGLITA